MPDTAEPISLDLPLELPQIQLAPIADFTPSAMNARFHPVDQIAQIRASIIEFGWVWPILRRGDTVIGAGHGRREAAESIFASGLTIRMFNGFELPPGMLPYYDVSHWPEAKFKAYMLVDNRLAETSAWDRPMLETALAELAEFKFDLTPFGFDVPDLTAIFAPPMSDGAQPSGASGPGAGAGSLAERFGVPPFSVLNAREGWWQARKAAWLSLGIRSEVGRGENLLKMSDTALEPDPVKRAAMQAARAKHKAIPGGGSGANSAWKFKTAEGYKTNSEIPAGLTHGAIPNYDGADRTITGTSIFDPVLCELAYRWFCPPGGQIIDPFAGGSVRGIVAAKLGRRYQGHELRPEQVEANRAQGAELCAEAAEDEHLTWIEGDSRATIPPSAIEADMVFSCPPYGDLEVYSDEDDDLSNMKHDEFLAAYREIIAAAVGKLKPDRFACFVVGEFRDKKGALRSFVPDTIAAFEAAGARFYNDAILVTSVGSLPIRAGKQFATTRKLGRTHQYVLVFVKGDPAKATAAVGECDFGEMAPEGELAASPPGDEPEASEDAPVPFAEKSSAA